MEEKYKNKIKDLKNYIKNLKSICQEKKKISFDDIEFYFEDEYKNNFEINDSSIGDLLIKCLEITPIQIAKIMGNEFKIMSDGENIDKKVIEETKNREENDENIDINIEDYSKMINFCLKDSILDYFELPVIVICCFGTQSIGKSTFLNELTGALFNVSGMRCTEGIWMSLKLFLHSIDIKNNSCDFDKCEICKKNKCYLLKHEKGKGDKNCICQKCICGKECILNDKNNNNKFINCDIKCCLKKDHEILIKCSYKECNCKCLCDCICDQNEQVHKHSCVECRQEQKKCECKECKCKHLCKYPILLHNFICIGLDFEGLGTFERTNEQDIQMALVGSAIGNSVIFRTHNSFDRFTEETLEKLSLGSKKIETIGIDDYFGGSIFFSPIDVIEKDINKLKLEFDQKIIDSIKNWLKQTKNEKRKYNIFGLFDNYVMAPTPYYYTRKYYNTLRNELVREMIENTFKYQRRPVYRTGKDFNLNLKILLSSVYMNDYEFLSNFKEERIKNYIENYLYKAYEVLGEYEEGKEELDEKSKIYFDEEFLKRLEINFSYNKKFENNDKLEFEIYSLNNIYGNHSIENYGITLKINKVNNGNNDKDNANNIFSISIENFKDFGLILNIPKNLKKSICYDDLCSELFNLWDIICKEIGLNDKDIIDNFNLFTVSLVKRRNNNVNKWLNEITKDFKNLKELQNKDSNLNNKWIICNQKCKYCYYKCCLLQNHDKEHKCAYDHKCKEKCLICFNCRCIEKNCDQLCKIESGHPDNNHSCKHFHKCKDNCIFKGFSNDCKGECSLEYGHSDNHNCKAEIHYCNRKCHLNGKARGCKEKCSYKLPHDGKEHDCCVQHYCMEKCYLKDKSEGCENICKLEFGHAGEHKCNGKHYCIGFCFYKDKAKNCKERCKLEYPHEGKKHDCGNEHFCKGVCSFKDKSEGCENNCKFKYDHTGNCKCNGKHYCIDFCFYKDKAKNCKERCKLEYPHEGKKHDCGNEHFCKGVCSLKDKSRNCKSDCILKFGHENECKCTLEKEEHICNGNCSINDKGKCRNNCILYAAHKGKCLCGQCNCTEPCKFQNCSRNCKKRCHLTAGHDKSSHICDVEIHFCKEKCSYYGLSRKCKQFCHLEVNHKENEHICEFSKKEHQCNQNCDLFENSRNCKRLCSLEFGHQGNHLCDTKLEEHLCKHKCYLISDSKECNKNCNKPPNHIGNHICSLSNHICKKKCSFYESPGIECRNECSLSAGHNEKCICSKPIEEHICSQLCQFYEKSKDCQNFCSLPMGHKNEHNCIISKENHKCNKICHLYGKTDENCKINCNLQCLHKGECKCSYEHLCFQNCSLSEAKSCNIKCTKLYGHMGDHLCDSSFHFCPKECNFYNYFYNKEIKGDCKQFCNLKYNHKGKCNCGGNHPCNKKCIFYPNSGGCNKECSKEYLHDGDCICSVEKSFHYCKEKCQLCNDDMIKCGHVYNHEKEYYINCFKCDGICKLAGKGHLCGSPHDCQYKCQNKGYCIIESNVRSEEDIAEYQTLSGEKIVYKITKFQKIDHTQCKIKIQSNEFDHSNESNEHSCKREMHKCGFQCKQCEYYCTEKYGHQDLHNCLHGNIKNSFFQTTDLNGAMIKKDDKYYKFKDGETAKIYFCEGYCREQGQGHTHLFESEEIICNNENVRLYVKNSGKKIYECKCQYFWETILKFNTNFSNEEKEKFSLCDWMCSNATHKTREYCQLNLWHKPIEGNSVPNGVYGNWVSKGHVFKCIHPNGIYVIFLVDESGSMSNRSIRPTTDINKKMDNMLGASIEAIINFCNKRFGINEKDTGALIGFNDKASLIFENFSLGSIDEIKNNCMTKLSPNGETIFVNAFKEASKIINNINGNDFQKIIILLTDGLDHNPEKTLDYIKSEVSKI